MAYDNQKGMALKIIDGVQMLDIHLPTLQRYLAKFPKDARGWRRFKCIPLPLDRTPPETAGGVPTSHSIRFVNPDSDRMQQEPPYKQRETKISGPTEFKKAG